MILLSFQPYYLLFTLAGIGLLFMLGGLIIWLRRKPVPAILLILIGLACVLLFIMAAVLHPEKMPW